MYSNTSKDCVRISLFLERLFLKILLSINLKPSSVKSSIKISSVILLVSALSLILIEGIILVNVFIINFGFLYMLLLIRNIILFGL